MTNHDLAHTLDAVANQMQVVAGLAPERRRSIGVDAHKVVELDGAVDQGVRLRRRLQPQHAEET